eukprot:CAMPEP_0174917478 /NCGR_PEP_ID=MMETSP1355-20121228/2482_1 /TAXON_ID=464990 /ORGANISM="Hemiselmis tepida, Strain CCMP443" /LENGTH=83 /DNA_ID=CAMNT_0016162571 /DNA_START=25 /DNA_END=273 /DNA_ORIENTATION=-
MDNLSDVGVDVELGEFVRGLEGAARAAVASETLLTSVYSLYCISYGAASATVLSPDDQRGLPKQGWLALTIDASLGASLGAAG